MPEHERLRKKTTSLRAALTTELLIITEESQGRNSSRNFKRSHRGMLLAGGLRLKLCFLIQHRTICLGNDASQNWLNSITLIKMTLSQDVSTCQCDLDNIFTESSFSFDSRLCQIETYKAVVASMWPP